VSATQATTRAALDRTLAPASIVVVGASRDARKIGSKVVTNLERGFGGDLYAVNPVFPLAPGPSTRWVTALSDVPGAVDLIVLAVPAAAVIDLLESGSIPAATGGILVLADESGATRARKRFEDALSAIAGSGVRVLGPNSSGFRAYESGLFVTFAGDIDARVSERVATGGAATSVSLVSPSGAMMAYLGGTLLAQRGVALDYVIDTGNEVDIDAAECVGFLAKRGVRRIGLVLEGTRDWRRFREQVSAASEAEVDIVALQVGRSARGREISATHTGAVSGSAGAFNTVVAAASAVAVSDDGELLDALTIAPDLVRGRERRVLLGSFSGGMNALITDQLADAGIDVPPLSRLLDEPTPSTSAGVTNPLDFGPAALVDFGPIEALMRLAELIPSLGATVVFTGHVTRMREIGAPIMRVIEDGARRVDHPVVVVGKTPEDWVRPAIPNLVVVDEPRSAARALAHAFRAVPSSPCTDTSGAEAETLPWVQAAALLAKEGAAVALTRSVTTAEAASAEAHDLGFPVVMKVDAPALLHRARHQLVVVGVPDEAAASRTFDELVARAAGIGLRHAVVLVQEMVPAHTELFVGAQFSDAFGPTVTVSHGGSDVEGADRDRVQLLLPFDPARCADALRSLHIEPTPELVSSIASICAVGSRLPGATVVEVNPLRISAERPGGVAVDCVILRASRHEGGQP
jgi:acyl-CoA synthetase (NDP forming)